MNLSNIDSPRTDNFNRLMTKEIYLKIGVLITVLCLLFFLRIPFVNMALAFAVIVAYVYFKQSRDLGKLFFNDKSPLELVSISLAYAILISMLSHFVLVPLIVSLTDAPIDMGMFDAVRGNTGFLFRSLAIGWIVGGLLEETIFRGYLLRTVEDLLPQRFGTIAGVIISSGIFGFLHGYQGISGQLLTGTAGVLFALIYLLHNRNLWLNILTHGFVNTISFLLIYFNIV